MNNITLEQIKELYNMLRGKPLPDGWHIPESEQPSLTDEAAFSVIWFIQERLKIIPDHFEQCLWCRELYDTHHGGVGIDATDEPDELQAEFGITYELIKEHDGEQFCSICCEAEFWASVISEDSDD